MDDVGIWSWPLLVGRGAIFWYGEIFGVNSKHLIRCVYRHPGAWD